jgi:hypothetical protein
MREASSSAMTLATLHISSRARTHATDQGGRESAGFFLRAASHVLPNAIFWEANPTQVFDFFCVSGRLISLSAIGGKADIRSRRLNVCF